MEKTLNYQEQAKNFLNKTGVKMTVVFKEYEKHFEDDKDKRDIYTITLERGQRKYKFDFGQSINASGKYICVYERGKYHHGDRFQNDDLLKNAKFAFIGSGIGRFWKDNKDFSIPSAYDVLACIEKNEVGTFEDFCSNFGYDEDSRKAEKIYKAVLNEYQNVCMLWNEEEIAELQEIN